MEGLQGPDDGDGDMEQFVIDLGKIAGVPGLLIGYMILKDRWAAQAERDRNSALLGLTASVERLIGTVSAFAKG